MKRREAMEKARAIMVRYSSLMNESELNEVQHHELGDVRSKMLRYITDGIMNEYNRLEEIDNAIDKTITHFGGDLSKGREIAFADIMEAMSLENDHIGQEDS